MFSMRHEKRGTVHKNYFQKKKLSSKSIFQNGQFQEVQIPSPVFQTFLFLHMIPIIPVSITSQSFLSLNLYYRLAVKLISSILVYQTEPNGKETEVGSIETEMITEKSEKIVGTVSTAIIVGIVFCKYSQLMNQNRSVIRPPSQTDL